MNWTPLLPLIALFLLCLGHALGSAGSPRVCFTIGAVVAGVAALLHVIGGP